MKIGYNFELFKKNQELSVFRPRSGWIPRRWSVGSAATGVPNKERRREINKEYCFLYAWLILCHVAVQNIYPIREHRNPINSLYVLRPIAAS
jgi:hypothetical protein